MSKRPTTLPVTFEDCSKEALAIKPRTPEELARLDELRRVGREKQVSELIWVRRGTRLVQASFEELVDEAVTASGNFTFQRHRPVRPAGGWPRRLTDADFLRTARRPDPGLARMVGETASLTSTLRDLQVAKLVTAMDMAPWLGTTFEDLCRQSWMEYQARFH